MVYHIPDLAAQLRFSSRNPSSGEPSAELQYWRGLRTAAQEALEDKMHTFAAEIGEIFTDYTVIA